MNPNDDKLNRLLRQWREIEPATNFDAQVWRRIRQSEPEHAPSFADWLRAWLPQPAFALTASRIVGVLIGASSGLFSVSTPAPPTIELSFLGRDTLTGSFNQLSRR